MTKQTVYEQALRTFGYHTQEDMCIEELAEAIHAICKIKRIRSSMNIVPVEHAIALAEEIADVEIMIEQMKSLHDLYEKVESCKMSKLRRLKQAIKEKEEAKQKKEKPQYQS